MAISGSQWRQSVAIIGDHLDDRVAVVQDLLVGQLLARTDDRAVLKLTPIGVHAIAWPIRVHEDVRDAHGEGLVVVAAVEGRDGAVRALRGHDGGLGDAIKEADDAGTPTRHTELPMGWVDARGSAHRDA